MGRSRDECGGFGGGLMKKDILFVLGILVVLGVGFGHVYHIVSSKEHARYACTDFLRCD